MRNRRARIRAATLDRWCDRHGCTWDGCEQSVIFHLCVHGGLLKFALTGFLKVIWRNVSGGAGQDSLLGRLMIG
jgi:hypothetical protein